MRKILTVVLVAGFVIWLMNPETLSDLGNFVASRVSQTTQKRSRQAVLGIKNKVNEVIRKKSEQILGEAISLQFGTPQPDVSVVGNVPNEQNKQIILIDYLTQKNLKLELELNQDYYLDLRNVPEDYCLFIGKTSYPLQKNEYLKLRFDQSGQYDLFFERCTAEKFGQIIVE